MGAVFKVEVDPVRSIVRHYLAGFFEPADVASYTAARNAAHGQLICAPNQHVTLIDVRDIKIQQQDIVKTFGSLLADPRYHSRKLAFVVSVSLARMQLSRATGSRSGQYFSCLDEAEAWLASDDVRDTSADRVTGIRNTRVA